MLFSQNLCFNNCFLVDYVRSYASIHPVDGDRCIEFLVCPSICACVNAYVCARAKAATDFKFN